MDDLEMIGICAERMGVDAVEINGRLAIPYEHITDVQTYYDPLHDDAQAMALVKKFLPTIDPSTWPNGDKQRWLVMKKINGFYYIATSKDLNRAIVECVARMP